MNTNDLNARFSVTKRQRRSHAPRVECLESRELLAGYPVNAVSGLVNAALFAHKNTAFQTINTVDNALRSDLIGLLPVLTPASRITTAPNLAGTSEQFLVGANGVIQNYIANTTAQLGRFRFVSSSIIATAENAIVALSAEYFTFATTPVTPTSQAAFLSSVTATIDAV